MKGKIRKILMKRYMGEIWYDDGNEKNMKRRTRISTSSKAQKRT